MPCLNGTERNGHVYDFIYEWLNREETFIFCMIALNFTIPGVTYRYFLAGWNAFVTESMILARDVSFIILCVTILDVSLYVFFVWFPSVHKTIKYLILSSNVIMFLADLFTIYYFQLPVNAAMFDILITTNVRESTEFLQAYLLDLGFWLFICWIALLLFAAQKLFRFVFRLKLLLPLMLIVGSHLGVYAEKRELMLNLGYKRLKSSVALMRVGTILYDVHQSRQELNEALSEAKEVTLTKNEGTIPYVVFILGESTTRNHMALYGYALPTSPRLLERQKRFYVFEDVIAPEWYTVAALKKLFTFYGYGSTGQYFTYTSLFNILKKAGYRTVWFSNQEVGYGTDPRNVYSNQCDTKSFTESFKETAGIGTSYDGDLFPLVERELASEHAKNFYVIHLLGTHIHYYKRYPKDFARFTLNDEGGYEGITNTQREIRAYYDNAVLYNDFVVDELIRRFEDKNAIVIYISDHGEEVYDAGNFMGHFSFNSCNGLEIPMLIWVSEQFSQTYPELEARIASSVNRPYMTDDIIHTVLDLMSIETDEYDPTKSVINPKFDSLRPRIFLGMLYDKETGLRAIR